MGVESREMSRGGRQGRNLGVLHQDSSSAPGVYFEGQPKGLAHGLDMVLERGVKHVCRAMGSTACKNGLGLSF